MRNNTVKTELPSLSLPKLHVHAVVIEYRHASVAHLLSESELRRDVERHARARHRLRRLRRCRLLTRTCCLSLTTSLRVWLQSPFLSSALFVITDKT